MSETLVKICGLTNLEDTLTAIEMGADFLGFNFYPESSRFIDYALAKSIFQEIPTNIPKVGVFVNEYYQNIIDLVQELELDYVQFHGDESPEFCNQMGHPWFKAIRLASEESLANLDEYECEWILADAFVKKGPMAEPVKSRIGSSLKKLSKAKETHFGRRINSSKCPAGSCHGKAFCGGCRQWY